MPSTLLLVALLAACGGRGPDVVVVGSKNFTEQRILGELLAQTAESVGLRAERKLDLGGTFVCDTAIRAGQIDMYVEYTGTALAAILKEEPQRRTPREIYERVRDVYAKDGLVWLDPLGFDNTFALVIRDDDAKRLGVGTISDAVPHARAWTAGFGYEFKERADGYAGLRQAYGIEFGNVRVMDLGLLYRALMDRQVDVAVGSATDAQIERLSLTILRDDRSYFPAYEAAPIVRRATLDAHPALGDALRRLAGHVSVAAMRRANNRVDGEHASPGDAARELISLTAPASS